MVGSDISSWYLAANTVFLRFFIGALVLLPFCWKALRRLKRSEFRQGLGLGLFGVGGLIFQMDGLNYTDASVSAFLTQIYCVIIPFYKCWTWKRWPNVSLWTSCVLIVVGIVILSGATWTNFSLGRGEIETIFSSLLFTGQILWLERPEFVKDNPLNASFIMFVVTTLLMGLLTFLLPAPEKGFFSLYSSEASWFLIAVLAIACTLLTFAIMVKFQPRMDATEAGLIYCIEPVFAAAIALFLPGMLGAWLIFDYPNEVLTPSLVVGATFITIANFIILRKRGKIYS